MWSLLEDQTGNPHDTGEQVAVKILKANLSERALNTIMTEINALKGIGSHPNVIKLHEFDK